MKTYRSLYTDHLSYLSFYINILKEEQTRKGT